MKKVLIIGFACVVALNMWAERVSVEDAAVVANNFMNVAQPASGVHRAPAKRMVLKAKGLMDEGTNGLTDAGTNGESSEPQYYIYENANGEGWVMVAANDVVRPILAYSHTGSFRTDHMPANIKSWLNGYKKQIAYSAQHATQADAKVQREWLRLRSGARRTTATPVVAPLIKTGWDQDTPYWNLCPTKNDQHCYTGCVATAMAQVMKYWEWPKQGIGSHTIPGTTYSADFGATTYDWTNMKNSYSGSSTAAQKTAVATLMYHCGVAADMEYGTNSSGAYTIDYNGYFSSKHIMCAETALKQFFGYKSTVVGYYRDGWTSKGMRSWTRSEWIAMLKSELDAHRPIMYAGAGCDDPNDDNTCYGHSFICDGYDSNDYFHFNWGWSNWGDGYYDVDALAPTETGAGAGNGEYNLEQDVIVGIEPPETGHEVVKNATGCTISCAAFALNDEAFTVTITPKDASYDFTSLTVQLGSATLTLNTDYTLSANHQTLTINAAAISGDENNDLTITAVWTKTRYLYALLGENCTPDDLSGTLAMSGVALELTIMPDEGYTLANADCWDVEMGDETLVYGTDFTYDASTGAFSIASVAGDVLIFVYGGKSVTWRANGNVFATNMAIEDKISLPVTEPAACEGKEFVGWTATENYESATVAPTFAEDGDTYSVATYYAVYATPGEGGGGSVNDQLTNATTGVGTVSDYANWSGKSGSSGAVYAGNSAGSNGTIQLRSNNSNSGIVSTTSGGTIAKVTVDWNNGTANGRVLQVIGRNTAYTEATNLYGSGRGTVLGTIEYGSTTELTISGSYEYVGVRSSSGALYLNSITFTWNQGGVSYGDYTTHCEACELTDITLNTDNVTKAFTTGDTFSSAGLVVTANYSNCGSKTVTPTDVSTPNMNVAGNKTVTVTYTENEVTKTATYDITVTDPPTYTIRFYDKGALIGDAQTVEAGQQPEVPADPEACDGYTFVGWWGRALAEDNTTAYSWTSDFTATQDTAYYAIFSHTETEAGENSPFDGSTPGVYKIYALVGTTKYYATGSVSSGKIESTTDEAEASEYVFEKLSGGFAIKIENRYITYTGSKTNLGTATNTYTWDIEAGSAGSWRVNSETNGRALAFSTSGKFGGYSTSNIGSTVQGVTYYDVEIGGSGATSTTYYSSESCGSTTDIENTAVVPTAQKLLRNGQIVIIRGEAVYTITGERIQ